MLRTMIPVLVALLSANGLYAVQDANVAIDALNDFGNSFRGYRVEYTVTQGKYDLPQPKVLSKWDGILIWDREGQKQIEYYEEMYVPTGIAHWERGGSFIGSDFSVGKGESADLQSSDQASGYVKSNGEDPMRPWWLRCAPGVISLNSEDDRTLILADLLKTLNFAGLDQSGNHASYRFDSSLYGEYTIELDDENRIAGIEIIKKPSSRWKEVTTIDAPPFNSTRLVVTYGEFEYDKSFGVCTRWRRIAEFWPESAEQPQQLEWNYVAKSVSKVHRLDPDEIKFETVTIGEGSRFTAQDDQGIEYIWSDNQIVRVVDSGTLEAIDGSEFVPARESGTFVKYLVVVAVCLLLVVSVVIYCRSKQE